MAMTKKTQFDKMTFVTGLVAIASIIMISLIADSTITANQVYEENPCKLIKCGKLGVEATAEGFNTDTGNVICKCPNRPDINYQVAKIRGY